MTPRGVSVYSTLQQAQAAYLVARGYTTDVARGGGITHGWISITPDGTEIDFNTGPNYAEDGRIVGVVVVLGHTTNR